MGLLDTALGNAVEAQSDEVNAVIGAILVKGEKVSHAYVVGVRDLFLITSLRLILVDKTGITGKKMHIASHPWRTVLAWSMTTSGKLDFDCELILSMHNRMVPLVIKFPKKTDIKAIVKSISEHVLL